jgi:hypothetical protein
MTLNDFGKKLVVEQCRQIRVEHYLKSLKPKLKASLLASQLEIGGIKVALLNSRTGFSGTRYWFSCPLCNRRVGVLFKHPISNMLGCRQCLGLKYSKSRYKGMLEENLNKHTK